MNTDDLNNAIIRPLTIDEVSAIFEACGFHRQDGKFNHLATGDTVPFPEPEEMNLSNVMTAIYNFAFYQGERKGRMQGKEDIRKALLKTLGILPLYEEPEHIAHITGKLDIRGLQEALHEETQEK